MSYSRRNFLRDSSLVGTGLLLSGLESCASKLPSNISTFGLQLYSLRDDLPADPKGVLKQVASFGYKQVESYSGDKGIFWGMKNTEFKSFLDGIGMEMPSSHCKWDGPEFDALAAQAGEIGMKYLICPHLGAQKSIDDFKRFAAAFNKAGEICRKHGLRFAYHNHDYSFKPVNGQLPQSVMMDETDPSLVDFEMDMYWVTDAGADIESWLAKYKNRFRLCHIKDRLKTINPKDDNNSTTLGEGSINFSHLLKVAAQNGVKYFIVEQERYAGTTPLKSAADNAVYMKTLKLT
ncbi:MAG: sugar phosphate isomerase/epimerase [Chitinophagaceae bacterium]